MKRRAPTLAEKVDALLRIAPCARCGGLLGVEAIDWDHTDFHALGGSMEGRNLTPLHRECHRIKTIGTHVPLSGDISVIAKLKRVTKEHLEFQRRLLAKRDGVDITTPGGRKKWPSRPFSKRPPR